MKCTVLDRKEAIAHARDLGKQNEDVVEWREGNLLEDDFGKVDVALLCNILHHFPAKTNAEIATRVHDALAPGGTIGIFDIETADIDAPPEAAGDALALYFRITSTSSCFRAADYEMWLKSAGFVDISTIRSMKMPSRMLVVGRKK